MTPRRFFRNGLYDLLINQIGVQIDIGEIKVIGQALKNQFFFGITQPEDRLFQSLPSLFLFLERLFNLIGAEDPYSYQKISKTFFLFSHIIPPNTNYKENKGLLHR